MKKRRLFVQFSCLLFFVTCIAFATNSYGAIVHEPFIFETYDGYTIDGRLTYEEGAQHLPTVVIVTGSDPIDADLTLPPEVLPYLPPGVGLKAHKLVAEELAAMGFTVVRTGNRGCFVDQPPDLDAFHTNTVTNRMLDTVKLIWAIHDFPQVNMGRLYLYGFSEGNMVNTILMSLVPKAKPLINAIKGIIMVGPVIEDLQSIVHFQGVEVQYDQLVKVYTAQGVPPEAFANGVAQQFFDITVEIEPGVFVPLLALPPTPGWVPPDPYFGERWETYLRAGIPPTFDHFDTDQDGFVQRDELEYSLETELYDPLVSAVLSGDEEGVAIYGEGGGVYSLAQYQDWFIRYNRPHWRPLDRLYKVPQQIPVAILVGENDINTPASQLDLLDMSKLPNVVTEIVPEEHHYGRELINRAYYYLQEWEN